MQQTSFTEFLVALSNALFGKITTLEGSPIGRLIMMLQSFGGLNARGQQNRLLQDQFLKSIEVTK
jgi:hypothetical protein